MSLWATAVLTATVAFAQTADRVTASEGAVRAVFRAPGIKGSNGPYLCSCGEIALAQLMTLGFEYPARQQKIVADSILLYQPKKWGPADRFTLRRPLGGQGGMVFLGILDEVAHLLLKKYEFLALKQGKCDFLSPKMNALNSKCEDETC